jgi:hypothetical protein
VGLVEVLEDDGDVHVDDNHEVDDDEGDKVDDGDEGEAAVAVWEVLEIFMKSRFRDFFLLNISEILFYKETILLNCMKIYTGFSKVGTPVVMN